MIQNRRDYYRIKANAHILYQLADPTTDEPAEKRLRHPAYLEMMDELHALDTEFSRLLSHLADGDRTSAALFRVINQKTDIIARSLALTEANIPAEEFQMIDISEGGMAFHAANPLSQGQLLSTRIILLPELLSVYCQAQVVESEVPEDIAAPEKLPHWTRVNFVSIEEKQQQLLARYVLKLQQKKRRKKQG